MRIYGLVANYFQLLDKSLNEGETLYIDGRPKASGNVVGFINSSRPRSMNKKPNYMFEKCQGNKVVVFAIVGPKYDYKHWTWLARYLC